MVIRAGIWACLLLALSGCGDDLGESVATGGSASLAAPANLSGTILNGGTEIVISWTDRSTEETGFRVEVSFVPDDFDIDFLTLLIGPNITSTVYNTTPNVAHYIRVVAFTATEESLPSNVVAVATPDVPLPPFYASALATGPGSVELRWVNAARTEGQLVERSIDGGATWIPIRSVAAVPGPVAWIDATVPAPDTACLYRIRGTGPGGAGGCSFASTVTQTTRVSVVALGAANGANDTGSRTSLALLGGRIHVSHFDQSVAPLGSLLYTTDATGTFATTIVDDGHDAAGFSLAPGWHGTSLALNAAGNVHIAASTYHVDRRIRYATNAGGTFAAETVDATGGTDPKIAVSPVNGEVLLLWRTDAGAVRLARNTGSGWTQEGVSPDSSSGMIPWLGVDGAGWIHAVVVVLGSVWTARREGFGWAWEQVSIFGSPDHTSAAFGPGGTLHIAFHDASTGELKYASKSGVSWKMEVVHPHPGGNLGLHNAIAVFPSGRVAIVYSNPVQGDLWGAWKDPGGAWQPRLLDSVGDVGSYASVAVDGNAAVISSYDATNGNLKVLVWTP